MKTVKECLTHLETMLREEVLTLAQTVDHGTVVCAVETLPQGIVYHQFPLEKWPEGWQHVFMGKAKGFKHGNVKIVAIYHCWV